MAAAHERASEVVEVKYVIRLNTRIVRFLYWGGGFWGSLKDANRYTRMDAERVICAHKWRRAELVTPERAAEDEMLADILRAVK